MWQKARWVARRLGREQNGQSLIILSAAAIGLVIIVGFAIDLGRMYTERIRLGRACDAAALAAAQELPDEGLAARRALQYLEENGYGPGDVQLEIFWVKEPSSPPPDSPWTGSRGMATIRLISGGVVKGVQLPVDKIQVKGRIDVPLTFMLVANLFPQFDFSTVGVEAEATAEGAPMLDVAIVYDASASMNDDTYCYNCFTENYENPKSECYGCYIPSTDRAYPAGQRLALPLPHEYCGEQQAIQYEGYDILVSEAEWFSDSTSVAGGANDYHREVYTETNRTFWLVQRVEDSQASGHRFDCDPKEGPPAEDDVDCSPYREDDFRGAHMMHLPWLYTIPGHSYDDLSEAPRMDYTFSIPTARTWYLWIRAQCGPWPSPSRRSNPPPPGYPSHVDGCQIHWGVDGDKYGSSNRTMFDQTDDGDCRTGLGSGGQLVSCYAPREGGTRGDQFQWKWIRLGGIPFGQAGTHDINLWGGGTGFRVDKLVLTTNPDTFSNAVDQAPAFIQETTPEWNEVRLQSYQTYWVDTNPIGRHDADEPSGGPPDTGGRSGLACDACNPIYGLRIPEVGEPVICDNTQDDMLDDAQPIRAAKEAAKGFVRRMRARVDQVGFVSYNTDATIERELHCSKIPGQMPTEDGIWDPETGPDAAWTWCFDHPGDSGNRRVGSILGGIENMDPGYGGNVWTNIADGISLGQEVLMSPTYGRPSALKFMILLTDGVPNRWPGNTCYRDENLWPYPTGDRDVDRAKDCVIYFAKKAADENIMIFTVGLGISADGELLARVAELSGGEYFYAQNAEELNQKLQQIADRIHLRLVG
jgi:hypothetical protein